MCLSTFRSRCSLTAIVISSLSALSFSNAAFAQAPEDETVAVQSDVANAADDQSTGDAIVVTGSRIPRVGFDTLEPATTISSQLVESRGQTNIVDTLTATPSFGLGQTPQGQQGSFNAGQSFADRFGLGSARTLTLFNGRRVVSTNAPSVSGTRVGTPAPPGLQVDLNIIPTLLVERVENLSIGGAPAYGSDAISGVVNVILKSKYSGLTVSALSGITEQGDNFRLNVAGLAGTDFAEGRGNVMFAASYDRSEGVLGSARKRIRQAYDFDDNPSVGSVISNTPGGRTTANDGRINSSIPFNSGNADGVPASVLIRNFRAEGLTTGGVILPVGQFIRADGTAAGFGVNGTTRLQFDPSGNLIPYNPAIPFSGFFGSGGDGFNLSETTQILSDVKRISLNLNASFELTPNIEVFAESMYFNGKGRELVDQPTYATPLVGSRTNPQGPLLVSVSDPRLTDQARTLLTSLGVSTFNVSKAYLGFIDGRSMSSNDVYRAVGGIRGKFGSFGREFTYEVSANYGRTEGNYLRNQIIQQNFVNALNVRRDASGAIVCDANPAFNVASGTLAPVLDAACVPLNPFGTDGVSKAAANYVTARTLSRSLLEQTVFSANISTGSLIDLWSGPVGFSIGAETRREHGRFTPDPLELAGRTQNPAIAAADGSFRTKEVFGELEIPLISEDNNIPLVHALSVEGRARYVDNSINGGFTTYTLGGRYQPVRDITFRGNFTRALRAPAIVELFTPNAVGVSSFPDPCDSANVASGPNPSIRARNCAAFYSEYGLNPANFVSQAKSVGQATLDGGNINLQNETSNAYTFGFVLRPSFMPRMTMAVDWNRIKIKGPIAQLTTADIASGCYDNPDFDLNNPDAGNQFCSLFSRDATGQLVNDRSNPGIRRTFVNGGSIDFRGLTANVNYAGLPLDGVGLADTTLSLDGSFFYLDRLCRSINAVTTTCAQGTITNPRYSGQLSATLAKGPFSLFTEVNYQSGGKYDLTFTNETQDILKVDSLITVNAAIGYGINDDWSMRFTVTNLFDTPPPFPLTTGDLLGRRFVVRVTKTF
ncbi:TonB-dependent receptor domain-containing protein [Sphingobium boeckii]|uniref:Outer membrane receptor protein involved in Fe transport n=1 Tax=Sphingobium boeckii TaxID=1082345 RepID=A0A7W9ED46_9SPHN|nr:TonB-dependent receptor [Sphingobium boeckii]MBB5684752.1 outer membrane receptor protein involved in Fe transport [Sphingobium boeckii]